jgi:hypothetical protein
MSESLPPGRNGFRYSRQATGGDSQQVCSVTASRMLNQTISTFICRIGMKIGTMMTTIGTTERPAEDEAQARITRIRTGGCSRRPAFAMKVGVPRAENTEPMNVDATSRIITMFAVCAVRNTESFTAQLSLPWAA